jgi:aqualysin 1
MSPTKTTEHMTLRHGSAMSRIFNTAQKRTSAHCAADSSLSRVRVSSRIMKNALFLLIGMLPLLAACGDFPGEPRSQSAGDDGERQAFGKSAPRTFLVDRYIVVFKTGMEMSDAEIEQSMHFCGGKTHFRYHAALKGFAATIPGEALNGMRNNPRVAYVESDQAVSISGVQQSPPSWGLDRIDQHSVPLDANYTYQNDGAGVTVYIIDTGIRFDHQEFGSRASSEWDFVENDADASDGHGHGTHVAGIVGGNTVGVAKNVTLKAVRVLDANGCGSVSGLIAGIDRVISVHGGPTVANLSVGAGFSSSLNQAVNNAVAAGIVVTVAAGNNGVDASNSSPASASNALTVGASTNADARASYSNYGSCVDLFAPGSDVYSSTISGTDTYASWSGTSMASPHVAGAAALYLSANPTATPAHVETALKSAATAGVLTAQGSGSPNLLLYSLTVGLVAPVPAAPTNLTATAVGQDQINLSWSDISTNELGFLIERSTDNLTFTAVGSTPANTPSFVSTGLQASTGYFYRVYAYNTSGNSQTGNTASATTHSAFGLHLASLSGASTQQGNKWTAKLTVVVLNGTHQPVPGATVHIAWSGGAFGSASGTTNASGTCTINESKIGIGIPSVSATVVSVAKPGYTYYSIANHVNPPTAIINRP